VMENRADDVGNRMSENFDGIRQEVSQKTQEIRDTLHAFVEESPLRAVGIAFGLGYLLSGALVSRVTARLVGIGGRIIIGNLLRQAVAGIGPGLIVDALRGETVAEGAGVGQRTQTEKH